MGPTVALLVRPIEPLAGSPQNELRRGTRCASDVTDVETRKLARNVGKE